jgi:hypothetical protein
MQLRMAFVAAAAAFALFSGPATADPASILWTSDQFRAAHPAPEPALAFHVKRDAKHKDGKSETSELNVMLTRDYIFVSTAGQDRLDDLALCRTIIWSPGATRMQTVSCYAAPAFLANEMANRQYLRRLMTELTKQHPQAAADLSPYWAEAELGLPMDGDKRLGIRQTADGADYQLGDRVVANRTGRAADLSVDEAGWLSRYVLRSSPLHPEIRKDILAARLVPAVLHYVTGPSQGDEVTLVVTGVQRTMASYPLPIGLAPDLTSGGDQEKARAVSAFIAAVAGHPNKPRPSMDTLLDEFQKDVAAHQNLPALLIFFNLTQQYGGVLTGPNGGEALQRLRPGIAQVFADPEASKFRAASHLAGDPKAAGDRVAALKALAGLNLDGAPFATFRNVTFANLAQNTKDKIDLADPAFAAMPKDLADDYWVHIAAYPWASNAYKDVGDYYFRGYDTPSAWQAYDMGRTIDPAWTSGAMASVSKMEDGIRQQFPDFF